MHNPDTWTDVLARLKLDAAHFVTKSADEILKGIKNQDELSQVNQKALGLCSRSKRSFKSVPNSEFLSNDCKILGTLDI